jgi:hypothetical protein
MTDASQYADSAQARQLDRDLEQRRKPELRLVERTESNEDWAARQRDHEERSKAASKALVKRGLSELEAFFGKGRA